MAMMTKMFQRRGASRWAGLCLVSLAYSCGPATPAGPSDTQATASEGGADGQSSGRTSPEPAGTSQEPLDLTLDASAVSAAWSDSGSYAAAVRAKGPWLGKLLVVLPEAAQPPSQYRELLRVAARGGLHAVAIPTGVATPLDALCGADTTCYGAVRGERLDGIDRSDKVEVTSATCLTERIVRGVMGLESAYPGQNWGKYVQGNKPLWANIVLAGHGDGAGQAAYAATQAVVARVALLGGPNDGTANQPAAWVTSAHATPTARWQGFGHTADPLWPRTAASWTALGLGAGPLSWPSVDSGTVFGATAMTSALASSAPALSLGCDDHTPRDSEGRPRYRGTWLVLVGGAPY